MNIDDITWSVSSSGFSIKADDELGTIVREYSGAIAPLIEDEFINWLEYAERVCVIHNAGIILAIKTKR